MALPRIATPTYKLTIPSIKKAINYRPFLVKEEKILLLALESDDENQITDAVCNIIENCISEQVTVKDLAMFDIEYIFLQLRAKSKGEELELEIECEDCKNPIGAKVNLNDVSVQEKEGHNTKIELTDSVGVVMKYPSIEVRKMMSEDKSEMENIFNSLVHCIDSIWDENQVYASKDHTLKELEDFFESLPEQQFDKIQKFFTTMPSLHHDINIKCNASTGKGKNKKVCGWKSTKRLEGLHSFFA